MSKTQKILFWFMCMLTVVNFSLIRSNKLGCLEIDAAQIALAEKMLEQTDKLFSIVFKMAENELKNNQ